MRLRGDVQAVDGVTGDAHRGIETKGQVRAVDVVVDRLGHTHDGHSRLGQPMRSGQRALTTDGNQHVDTV